MKLGQGSWVLSPVLRLLALLAVGITILYLFNHYGRKSTVYTIQCGGGENMRQYQAIAKKVVDNKVFYQVQGEWREFTDPECFIMINEY